MVRVRLYNDMSLSNGKSLDRPISMRGYRQWQARTGRTLGERWGVPWKAIGKCAFGVIFYGNRWAAKS
eukprot:1143892-Pelagomonas_calceolata.AAC.6